MAVDSSIYDVAQIPFPAITICSNNKIVERQLESVLLTQPWKSLAKKDPEFTNDFKKALTAIVMARENPPMLDNMNDKPFQDLGFQAAMMTWSARWVWIV